MSVFYIVAAFALALLAFGAILDEVKGWKWRRVTNAIAFAGLTLGYAVTLAWVAA